MSKRQRTSIRWFQLREPTDWTEGWPSFTTSLEAHKWAKGQKWDGEVTLLMVRVIGRVTITTELVPQTRLTLQ